MYGFLLNMWIMGKIDQSYTQNCVPKYLTQTEADMILATPQNEK